VISDIDLKFPRAAGTCWECKLSRIVYPAKKSGEDIWICVGCAGEIA
jgi:hypothetical protein